MTDLVVRGQVEPLCNTEKKCLSSNVKGTHSGGTGESKGTICTQLCEAMR